MLRCSDGVTDPTRTGLHQGHNLAAHQYASGHSAPTWDRTRDLYRVRVALVPLSYRRMRVREAGIEPTTAWM